jgi:hypothetical protein
MADENDTSLFLTVSQTSGVAVNHPPPTIVINGDNGSPLVKIHPDGALEYGPNYDPDEAARRFWDSMRHYLPTRCPGCGRIGLLEGPQ